MRTASGKIARTVFGWAILSQLAHADTKTTQGQWIPLAGGIAGTSTISSGLAWDDNGSLWACGPDLLQAGSAFLPGIGRYDSASGWSLPGRESWSIPSPSYTNAKVKIQKIASAPDGKIWALGDSGFVRTYPLVRSFSGTGWKTETGNLGCANKSFECPMEGLAFDAQGNPLVAGIFSVSSSDTARPGIARRVAGTWQRIDPPSDALLRTMIPLGGDSLAVGGNGVWIWDGSRWSLCGMDSSQASRIRIGRLMRTSDGSLLAAALRGWGERGFHALGLEIDLAGWDGAHWTEFGKSADGPLRIASGTIDLARDGLGRTLVLGDVQRGADSSKPSLVVWTGQRWDTLAQAEGIFGDVRVVATDRSGRLAMAGNFCRVGSVPAWNLAIRTAEGWRATDSGFAGRIASLVVDGDGGIVVGGAFSGILGKPVSNIARWDGKTWNALGAGLDSQVTAMTVGLDGSIVATGRFRRSGGDSIGRIARFDGTRWTALAPDFPEAIAAIAASPDGGIWAGRSNGNIAQYWNGSTWTPAMKYDSEGDYIHSIAASPDGSVRLVGTEYVSDYQPRIWSASPTSKSVNLTPAFSTGWWVNDVVALRDSVFAYSGRFCDSCPLAIEDHGVWKALPSISRAGAASVVADAQGRLYATLVSTETSVLDVALLRQTGDQATVIKGLEGSSPLLALDSIGSAVVAGALGGNGGATIYLLKNAGSIGVKSPAPRSIHPAFQARGRDWIANRPGRLEIVSSRGGLLWSGKVEAGFSLASLSLEPGIHFARLDGQTARLLFPSRR